MYTLEITEPDKLFFTSDTHFAHYNICRYCGRPFGSRSEMDHTLIGNWNRVVPEDGVVVHCGDFMLNHKEDTGAYLNYMRRLNGRILLIRGNHDYISLCTEPQENLLAVVDKALITVDGLKIYADHYPCLAFNGDLQVFGHIHTLADGTCHGTDGDVPSRMTPDQYDVGVDLNGYAPVSWKELRGIFERRGVCPESGK